MFESSGGSTEKTVEGAARGPRVGGLDLGCAAAVGDDDPGITQRTQGLAHGAPTHSVLLGELHLAGEAVGELTGVDPGAEVVVDALPHGIGARGTAFGTGEQRQDLSVDKAVGRPFEDGVRQRAVLMTDGIRRIPGHCTPV